MSEMPIENVAAEREPFVVDNDMKAEWCMNKIRKIREEQKRETDELWRQMRFYQDQMEIIEQKANSDAAFFENMLHGYFIRREEDGFTKSTKTQTAYKLPSGKLVLKKQQPEYERNDGEVIAWLKQNGGKFIKTKESLDWSELKKTVTVNGESVVTSDGEVIPGVKVIEREDVFEVEVN